MSNGPVNPFNLPAGPPLNTNPGGGGPTGNLLDTVYSFTIQANPVCWDGTATAFETSLLTKFDTESLERLRVLLLQYSITEVNYKKASRAILQMAYETEISSVIADYVPITEEIQDSVVCPRRKYLAVDTDMRQSPDLYEKCLSTLAVAGVLPESYLRLFRNHLSNTQPKHRICAACALLCYAAKMRDSGTVL